MSDNEQAQRTNLVSQEDKTRKLKHWGLGLVGLGLAFELIYVYFDLDPPFGLLVVSGMVLCGIGLSCFAKSRERSMAWGGAAIFPFIGPLLGLLILAVKRKPKTEQPPSKVMSLAQLKWGPLLYAGALWLLPLQAGGLSCLTLPDEQYPPLNMVEGSNCGVVFFAILPFSFFLSLVFLHECGKAVKTFGVRASAGWLALRAIIIGLTLIYAFSSLDTTSKAARMVEARTTQLLAALQPGMTKDDVERAIVHVNASLIPPSADTNTGTKSAEETEYQKVRDVVGHMSQGQPVNFKDLHFHRALFNLNPDSLDRIAGPKSPPHGAVFVRSCCQLMFRWTRYDLFVEYDSENRMTSARYLKSDHEDGEDRSCSVLLEVPAPSGKQYPVPCSSVTQSSQP
jgi:hypothetical protein